MDLIDTRDAVGHVLCHDVTRIVPGEFKGAAFRKGHVVREEDIEALLNLGKEHLYVWKAGPGILHEDEAASILISLCKGKYMKATDPVEGKSELIAEVDGYFTLDIERLRHINALGEMMIAARPHATPVKAGDILAGMRVIPLAIEAGKLEEARALAGDQPLLNLRPFRSLKAGVIVTGGEVMSGRIQDGFTPVLIEKLRKFGSEVVWREISGDDHERIAKGISRMIERGADMVLCTGGMSVDPDDRTPLAIRNTGAEFVSYGAPVLPGAMFMLAYLGGVPIVGLPGCVMYAKRTIFDLVLPRMLADVRVTASDLAGLGNGGLCLNCDACAFPNCGFGRGV